MATNILRKFAVLGLRADRNLSDVADPDFALNGLLDNLVSNPDPEKAFISQDLDAIRGLSNTDVTIAKLAQLASVTVTATIPEDTGLPSEVDPLVRLVDRIENIKVTSGDVPAIQGGDGLLATFIPSTNVNTGETTSTGDTIFTIPSNPIQEVFWDNGRFNIPSFLDPTFEDQYGGIQWEGYFLPALYNDTNDIVFYTTGLLMVEIDPLDTGSWETLLNIYNEERTISTSTIGANTEFVIAESDLKFVSIGDFVDELNNIIVTGIGVGSITVSSLFTPSVPGSITLTKIIGRTETRNVLTFPTLEVGQFLKIRISFWFPDNGQFISEKYLELQYISTDMNFIYLYSVKPEEIPSINEFRQALDSVVSPFQNSVGASGNYKNLFVNNSARLFYQPDVVTLSDIRLSGPGTVDFSLGSPIITGSILSSAEIGSIVVPSAVPPAFDDVLQIKDTLGTTTKVLKINPDIDGAVSVNVINHRGFINWFTANSSGATVNLTNRLTDDILAGFIVITNSNATIIRVTAVTNDNTFTTSADLNLTGDEVIYIFSDKSLIDRSRTVFCNDVFGQVVSTTVSEGGTQITLDSVVGVVDGQYIQFDGVIPTDTQVVGPPVGNVITISNSILSGTQLSASSTVVFVPAVAGGTLNREGCVIPLNTAPPFIGTDIGLSTGSKNIKSAGYVSEFTVTTQELAAEMDTAYVTAPESYDTVYDAKVFVKSKLNNVLTQFSILSVKKP
jgi:hypothetical protein